MPCATKKINILTLVRGGATLCTRHAYTKYIIDNRMFTIQFENGLLFSIWDLLKCMIAIQKVYKYCYSLPPKAELY